MSLFEDNFSNRPDQDSEPEPAATPTSSSPANAALAPPLAGDPLSFASAPPVVVPYSQRPEVPEDLRISWSWVHLLCFGLFTLVVLAVVPSVVAIPYLQGKHLQPEKLQNYLFSIPQFVVGSTFAVFALVFHSAICRWLDVRRVCARFPFSLCHAFCSSGKAFLAYAGLAQAHSHGFQAAFQAVALLFLRRRPIAAGRHRRLARSHSGRYAH